MDAEREYQTIKDFEVQKSKNEICTGAKFKNWVLHLRKDNMNRQIKSKGKFVKKKRYIYES